MVENVTNSNVGGTKCSHLWMVNRLLTTLHSVTLKLSPPADQKVVISANNACITVSKWMSKIQRQTVWVLWNPVTLCCHCQMRWKMPYSYKRPWKALQAILPTAEENSHSWKRHYGHQIGRLLYILLLWFEEKSCTTFCLLEDGDHILLNIHIAYN